MCYKEIPFLSFSPFFFVSKVLTELFMLRGGEGSLLRNCRGREGIDINNVCFKQGIN